MTKTTSFRPPEDVAEYLDEMVDNKSEYIIGLIRDEMRTRGLTRREKLERELAEIQEEHNRKTRAAEELAERKAALEKKLGNYAADKEQEVEDALVELDWLVRVHPAFRGDKAHMSTVIRKTGIPHTTLVKLCDEVDIHYCDLLTNQIDALEEIGIGYDELDDHRLHDEEAGQELTDEEREQARAFLLEHF